MATVTLEGIIAEWAAQVRAAGAVVTRMPSGPDRGKLAMRTPAGNGQYVYALAPAAVQMAEDAIIAQERDDIADAQKLAIFGDAINAGGAWLASLPRRLVENALGLPDWFIPAVSMGLIVMLALQLRPRGDRR